MKLTNSLIIATLASSTVWAQVPTNQAISSAKSQVNSVGQAQPASTTQNAAKPSATSAKAAPAKTAVPTKLLAVTPKPVAAPAKQAAPTPSAATKTVAKAPQPVAASTKPAAPTIATKPAVANGKPAAPATAPKPATPAAVTKAAPAAIKAGTKTLPEKKVAAAEVKKGPEAKKPGEAEKKPAAKADAKPATKAEEKPATVAKPASAKEASTSRVTSMANKRDPFVSPIVRASAGGPVCETGKRCLMVDQIELKGIVKSPSGFIAVVENSMKRAYFLRENDPIFNGSVIKITGDTVTFRESTTDRLGKQGMREVVKKVNAPVV